MASLQHLSIDCKHCSKENLFNQPYPYHAGFADQGFLYNDAGNLTLVWSIFDPLFSEIFPRQVAWNLNVFNRRRFEKMLLPAPDGGRWRFHNPARCMHCGTPISPPMLHSIHYLIYPGSIIAGLNEETGLKKYLKPTN